MLPDNVCRPNRWAQTVFALFGDVKQTLSNPWRELHFADVIEQKHVRLNASPQMPLPALGINLPAKYAKFNCVAQEDRFRSTKGTSGSIHGEECFSEASFADDHQPSRPGHVERVESPGPLRQLGRIEVGVAKECRPAAEGDPLLVPVGWRGDLRRVVPLPLLDAIGAVERPERESQDVRAQASELLQAGPADDGLRIHPCSSPGCELGLHCVGFH